MDREDPVSLQNVLAGKHASRWRRPPWPQSCPSVPHCDHPRTTSVTGDRRQDKVADGRLTILDGGAMRLIAKNVTVASYETVRPARLQ